MDTILEEALSSQTLLLALLSYALGAIPFALIFTKWKIGKNIRKLGSGNIGATNAARVAGPMVGILTLLCDVAKAYIPVSIGISLGSSAQIAVLFGFCAFIGHCFPVWLRFSGGKGVATALGVLLSIGWTLALLSLLGFVAGYVLFKQVGAGSLMASLISTMAGFLILDSVLTKVIIVVMFVIIVIKHEENIRRLIFSEDV